MRRIQVSMQEIKGLHLEQHLTIAQIAEKLDCHKWIVSRRLREMGIPRQPYHHTDETKGKIAAKKRKLYSEHPQKWSKVNLPEDELRRLYLEEKMGSVKIARIYGCDALTVQRRLEEIGIPRRKQAEYRRELAPVWKGGRRITGDGYVKVLAPDHTRANSDGYVCEHIKVWEEAHGKPLPKGWVVHHLNGIRSDNRPSNLAAMPKGAHDRQFSAYKKRIRELEIENRQLRRALEDSQMIFYVSEN